MKLDNVEQEIMNVVEYNLTESLLFYGSEYEAQREEIFKEFEKQCIKLIRQLKQELEEDEE